jgi:hypothetical protein
MRIVADLALQGRRDMTTGANEDGFHLRGVDVARDIRVGDWLDLREVRAGESCPACGNALAVVRRSRPATSSSSAPGTARRWLRRHRRDGRRAADRDGLVRHRHRARARLDRRDAPRTRTASCGPSRSRRSRW